jgi:hypothetical protein
MNRPLLSALLFLAGLIGAPFGVQAGTATADNVVIDAGSVTYRIKHIEATDTALDNTAFAALFDTKTPQPLTERLAAVTAATITMPEIVAETKHDAAAETVIYRNVKLSDVKAGQVGTMSIAGASIAATTPKLDDLHGTIGALTASDVDLALVARVATVARTDPAEPRKPLYAKYAVDGFTLESQKGGFSFSVGPVTGSGSKGRALETPLIALGTRLAPRPGEATSATRARAAHALVDMLGSFELGAFEAKTIVIRSTAPDKPATLSLARLALTDAGGDKLGGISLEGFALESAKANIHLASLTLQNIDLAAVRKGLAAAETSGDPATSLPRLPATSGQLAMADLAADVAADGDGNSADGQRNSFHIDRVTFTSTQPKPAGPVEFASDLSHFVMTMPSQPGSAFKEIVALGYPKLDVSSRLAVAWTAASQDLQLKTASLTGDGMGTLTLSGLFSHVPTDLFSSDPAVMQAAAVGILLNKIDLRIDNAGLIDKALALQARNESKSVEDVRQAYVTGAGVAVPVMLGNGPSAKAIGAALAKFIAQPRSFHLVATAPDGLGASDLAALGDPAALLDKLDIQASANE